MKMNLNRLDLFGGGFKFIYKSSKRSRTYFGFLLTVIYFIITGIAIFFIGKDFFQRRNPQVALSTEPLKNYEKYPINNQNFSLAFRLEDSNGNKVIFDDFIYFDLWLGIYENDENGVRQDNSVPLSYLPCSLEDINDNIFIEKFNVSDFYCLKYNNFSIGGFWDETFIYYIYITANYCKEGQSNIVTNQKCLSNEEAELRSLRVTDYYLSLYHQKAIFDATNYEKGLTTTLINDYFRLDSSLRKECIYFMTLDILKSDIGWIFENSKVSQVLGVSRKELSITTNGNISKQRLVEINYNGTREHITYRREYSKIQSLSAEVGGIISLFSIIFGFLGESYSLNEFILKVFLEKNKNPESNKKINLVNNINQLIENRKLSESKLVLNKDDEKNSPKISRFTSKQNQINKDIDNEFGNNSDSKGIQYFMDNISKCEKIFNLENNVDGLLKYNLNLNKLIKNSNEFKENEVSFFDPIKKFLNDNLSCILCCCKNIEKQNAYRIAQEKYNYYFDISKYINLQVFYEDLKKL